MPEPTAQFLRQHLPWYSAAQHEEDTGRRVLTLDDRELGWHRAPISHIHDDEVGLSRVRLGKRLQIADFNRGDLRVTGA